MPRAVAFSAKQKREQLRLKRAIKRGDISPPPPNTHKRRKVKGKAPTYESANPSAVVESARRLQSSFAKLSKEFLEETKVLSASLPLARPLSSDVAVWNDEIPEYNSSTPDGNAASQHDLLTCPRRPKWRYGMTKKEVEKNEEGFFEKWLDQTDDIIAKWSTSQPTVPANEDEEVPTAPKEMPKAPTSFERNLEIWRQLWRVTEISQIILILLDSRCPLLHYPPSLASYLSSPAFAQKRTILVLTKVDISGPDRAQAWTQYLKGKYPHLRVVQVESYAEKSAGAGGRLLYEPHLPSAFRQTLVDTLKETHAELLQPPERIRDDPEKLKNWKSPVKREVDWDSVLNARGGKVGSVVGGAAVPKSSTDADGPEYDTPEFAVAGHNHDDDSEPDLLTIGLIGQPNVGKSSLLNALFGTQRVRASKTPGKTKHFQTLFWTPEVRLVDCPGLTMPNFVPMETQVLSGILPISRVSAVPLCTYHAASFLPLENIFDLSHPSLAEPPKEDKRTWRGPRSEAKLAAAVTSKPKVVWTAMDILSMLALKKGWITAKTGWPDTHRAGNFILRCLAEGKIKWAFWPPNTPLSKVEEGQTVKGYGVWIPHEDWDNYYLFHVDEDDVVGPHEDHDETVDENDEVDSGASDGSEYSSEADDDDDGEEEEGEGEVDGPFVSVKITASRFGALAVSDEEEGDEDEEEEK